ncbi:MAG: DUF485 domain-containing protein, partial [Mycobacteriales bacterium]
MSVIGVTRQRGAHMEGKSYEEIQEMPDFQQLKRSLRRFVFPMAAAFLAWYLLFIVMTVYA